MFIKLRPGSSLGFPGGRLVFVALTQHQHRVKEAHIINPLDEKMMANIIAAAALAGKDDF
jgi:hypothetical protein